MKKFKIKNRQKRKYVKKQDLAASFSHVQSLTFGVIPMMLASIAFLTTFIIGNPQIANTAAANIHFELPQMPQVNIPTINMPEVSLPEITLPALPELSLPKLSIPQINLSFKMPEVPAFELPKFTMPQTSIPEMPTISLPKISLPKVTAPDLISPVVTAFIIISNSVTGIIDAGIRGIDKTGDVLIRGMQLTASAVIFGITTAWQMTITALSEILTTVVNISIGMGNATVGMFHYLMHLIVNTGHAIANLLAQVWKALVDGWNAFVWFIGIPFRYIAHVMEQLAIALTPIFNFLGHALQNAVDMLKSGGDTLIKGTNYVTSTMGSQK